MQDRALGPAVPEVDTPVTAQIQDPLNLFYATLGQFGNWISEFPSSRFLMIIKMSANIKEILLLS